MTDFSELVGKSIVSCDAKVGAIEIRFVCSDGTEYKMDHAYSCCESVLVEDIAGDIEDILGSPILMAEESSDEHSGYDELAMWTFYKLATVKGYVTIRWNGESNGYYSVDVDFTKVGSTD